MLGSADTQTQSMLPGRTVLGFVLIAVVIAAPGSPVAAEPEFEPDVIDMRPEDGPASFGMRNVVAPLGSLFRGTDHYYGQRELRIDTTPSGGTVDLFYVRSGFQKRFEQAEAPVTVILPSRIASAERDILNVRAFREGFRQNSKSLSVHSDETELIIDLEPLPNLLSGFASRYFAGRASISFLTKESLTHRVQDADAGFAVILVETGMADDLRESLGAVANPLIQGIFGQQLGEDLMVNVDLTEFALAGSVEPRTRESYDAARELHRFSIDLIPRDGGMEAVARARAALPKLERGDISGCAVAFDTSLREQLDEGDLSRALNPHGSFAGPYLRAAMRRLGEISPDGAVEFSDGSTYHPSVPMELEMALTQAGGAEGYLALLRSFAEEVEGAEHAPTVLRSLVAPEMNPESFASVLENADAREEACLASAE